MSLSNLPKDPNLLNPNHDLDPCPFDNLNKTKINKTIPIKLYYFKNPGFSSQCKSEDSEVGAVGPELQRSWILDCHWEP